MSELNVPLNAKPEDSASTDTQLSAAQMKKVESLEGSLDLFMNEEGKLLQKYGEAFSYFVSSVGFFFFYTAIVVFFASLRYSDLVALIANLPYNNLIVVILFTLVLVACYLCGIVSSAGIVFGKFERLYFSDVWCLQTKYLAYYEGATNFVNEVLVAGNSGAVKSRIRRLNAKSNIATFAIFYKIRVILISSFTIGFLLISVAMISMDVLKEFGK